MPNELDVKNSPAGRQAQLNAIRGGNVNERRVAGTIAGVTDKLAGTESQLPGNTILRRDDGTMVYKRFVMTATGMEIPEGCQKLEWEDIGGVLRHVDSALAWWVGDWAEYANKNLEMTYEQVSQWLGGEYTTNTVEFYASVCRGVHGLVRNQAVSFSHHAKLAKFAEDLQAMWLNYAHQRIAHPDVLLTVSQLVEDIRLIAPLNDADQFAWLEWAQESPHLRFVNVEELKKPARYVIRVHLPGFGDEIYKSHQKQERRLLAWQSGKRQLPATEALELIEEQIQFWDAQRQALLDQRGGE